jgi:broad specificity phosphatase PhoE
LIKIILVRHAETDWNKEKRIQGSLSDTPLSETGKHQVKCVAGRLRSESIQAVYSSPLKRALHTAEAIAGEHGLEVDTFDTLREINVGELEGTLSSDVKMPFDQFVCRRDGSDELQKLPGGESLNDVQRRAWDTISSLASKHNEGTIVVVTHYFVIMAIVCRVLNLPLTQVMRLRLRNGTVTTFTLNENNEPRLESFNDHGHLQNN